MCLGLIILLVQRDYASERKINLPNFPVRSISLLLRKVDDCIQGLIGILMNKVALIADGRA